MHDAFLSGGFLQDVWRLRNYIRDANLDVDTGGEEASNAATVYNPRAGRGKCNELWARDSDALKEHYASQ